MNDCPLAPRGQFHKNLKIPLDIWGKEWYHTMRVVNTTAENGPLAQLVRASGS